MQSPTIKYIYAVDDEGSQEIADMGASVREVEKIINYEFKNKKILEEALTHSSYGGAPSYQRLEFVGDAAMGLAFSNFVFLRYPGVDPGKLSLVRAANISTEKLARVAVRHRLYNYVRHNVNALDKKVSEFVTIVQEEAEAQIYGGLVKAPKVLADIIESLAAAVYIDSHFNLEIMWEIIRNLLEPMVMLEALEQQPQPVTLLFELCQKDGKQVDIKYWAKEEKIIASVFVDGQFVTSASSEQKENAKLNAAKAALQKLFYECGGKININTLGQLNEDGEVEAAKQRLHEQCGKKKWPRPTYHIQKEDGRAHEKRYICSVEIEIADRILFVEGKEKARVKDAESSAASVMLHGLKDLKYI